MSNQTTAMICSRKGNILNLVEVVSYLLIRSCDAHVDLLAGIRSVVDRHRLSGNCLLEGIEEIRWDR